MKFMRKSGTAWPFVFLFAVVGILVLPGALQAQQVAVRGPQAKAPPAIVVKSCKENELVAAVKQANKTPAADTIVLKQGCTYALTAGGDDNGSGPNGLPIVVWPLTIHGNGATITHSAGPPFRLLQVGDVDVAIDHLTMSNGGAQRGGAILSGRGSLAITDSTFSLNTASLSGGAIHAGSALA